MDYFIDNKYTRTYFKIIKNVKTLDRFKKDDYYENHHIIPKCEPFFGSDSKDNRILLTPKEHFICHLLLTKMCNGIFKLKMAYALNNMTRSSLTNPRNLTSGQYSIAKKILSKNKKGIKLNSDHKEKLKGRIPWNKGKTKYDDPRILEQSLRMTGDNHHRPNLGKKMSEYQKKELSIKVSGENNPFFGKKHSEEFKKLQSERAKDRKHTEETKKIISEKKIGNKATFGFKWVNNNSEEKLIPADNDIPENYKIGRIYRKRKSKTRRLND